MNLNNYQELAATFAVYENDFYPMASLIIEASELVDLFVKPRLRGDDAVITRTEVVSEAGDVLWNLAVLLKQEGVTLDEVATYNIQKLTSRMNRGKLKGNGGDR